MLNLRKIKLRTAIPAMGTTLAVSILLLLGFQNCAKFTSSETFAKLTASCTAKIQESAPALLKVLSANGPVDCLALENYACEIRRFAPDVGDGEQRTSQCDGDSCAQLTTRTFDTKAALSSADRRDFEPGGEYNRTEAQCVHSARFRNTALFVGLGDDLTSALNAAKSNCLAAQSENGASR